MKLLRWKQIVDLDEPDSIYLSRLLLVKCRWFGIYVHLIRRADQARCEHDHPWPFLTVILRGGYEEEIQGKVYVRRPGYVGYRPRGFEHRITKLLHGTATTLVFRGFDYKAWGFRTNRGFTIPWEHYVNQPQAQRVAWCDDRLAAALKLPEGALSCGRAGNAGRQQLGRHRDWSHVSASTVSATAERRRLMRGRRVNYSGTGGLPEPGAFWKDDRDGNWYGVTPNGYYACFANHDVVEHEDGTITVSPSIGVWRRQHRDGFFYHGYLERGVWREV